MNNESIKEILELNDGKHNVYLPKEVKEAFTCIDYELSVCSCELPKILDYITNLQLENINLKNENKTLRSDFNNQVEYASNYKSRCEKAVEYINNQILINYTENDEYNFKDTPTGADLLNILKGDKDEQR